MDSKIVIISGGRGDTRRYRTLHLAQQLRLAGVPVVLSHITDPRLVRWVREARVLFIHRAGWDPYIQRLVQQIRENQGVVVSDIDDLIFDVKAFSWIDSPDFKDPRRARLYQEEMVRNVDTMQAGDAVLASTEFLADRAQELGLPVWIFRNAYSLEMGAYSQQARQVRQRPEDGKVVLGYASGTPTHNRDFELITPALQTILSRYPQVELHLIGYLSLDASWDAWTGRIRRLSPVSWRKLPEVLASWDINLAPLVMGNPFTRSKSEIKYMEAALVDVPTVASVQDAFSTAITSGENGFLAADTAQWVSGIEALLDPLVRQRVSLAASQRAWAEYSPLLRARQLVTHMQQICQSAGQADLAAEFACLSAPAIASPLSETARTFWLDESIELHPNRIEQGLYSLQHRGAHFLFDQTLAYVRRAIAPIFPYR